MLVTKILTRSRPQFPTKFTYSNTYWILLFLKKYLNGLHWPGIWSRYFGRLVTEYFLAKVDTTVRWALAGRNEARLTKFRSQIEVCSGTCLDFPRPLSSPRRQVDVDIFVAECDKSQIQRLASQTKVLLNCAKCVAQLWTSPSPLHTLTSHLFVDLIQHYYWPSFEVLLIVNHIWKQLPTPLLCSVCGSAVSLCRFPHQRCPSPQSGHPSPHWGPISPNCNSNKLFSSSGASRPCLCDARFSTSFAVFGSGDGGLGGSKGSRPNCARPSH